MMIEPKSGSNVHALGRSRRLPQARRWGRIVGTMAELLMNSAIPSEGSIRTSWPALRNGYWANQGGRQND